MDRPHIKAIEDLYEYIINENFQGYDPYDALNSNILNRLPGKWLKIIFTQINHYSTINFRRSLKIHKGMNPKGMGLFLQTFIKIKEREIIRTKDMDEQIDFLYHWLIDNSSKGHSGLCWGYNYPWQDIAKYIPENQPSVVVTSVIGNALIDYYKNHKDQEILENIKSVMDFILCDLNVYEDDDGKCFSYSPFDHTNTHNANLLGASFIIRASHEIKNQKIMEDMKNFYNFTVKKQNSDGSWCYSYSPKKNLKKIRAEKHIDYHQGFIIDSLHDYCDFFGKDEKLMSSIRSGLNFYEKLFTANGRSLFRYPKKWPTDIHSQAQGIITFSRSIPIDKKYSYLARNIAKWTLENMLSDQGYFYFHKWPFFTNKISHIRWAQAWMLNAMVCLISRNEGKNNSGEKLFQ